MLANFLEKNERARLGKSNWKGNGAFPKRSSQNKRLPPFMSRCVIQSSPTVISPRERSSVNTNLSKAEARRNFRAVTSHRSIPNAARSRGDLRVRGAPSLTRRVNIEPPPKAVSLGSLIDVVQGRPHAQCVVEGVPGAMRTFTPRA